MKKLLLLSLISLLYLNHSQAQTKAQSSSEILQGLNRLKVVGNAMYLAAHPDDENTLLIAWLSKEKNVRTAYMSMTRGDGGQNLIGTEQGAYTGILRTHELLEARKVDGGEQYFSRAIDFGFTKKTEEALSTWGREKVLEDVVWRIRKFKPDVIINRFPPDERAGHGHHSASAVLSAEAFEQAADPTKFPEQLKFVEPWQAKRVVWNSFSRGFTNNAPEAENFIRLSLGDYNALLGKSYPEIAAEARSMHKSQGFGSAKVRNERFDYAIHIKGEPAKNDLFDGIDLTWNRIPGGAKIDKAISEVIATYNISNPSLSLPALLKIREMMNQLPESIYKTNKKEELDQLIIATAGIFYEANPTAYSVYPGEKFKGFASFIKRSNATVVVNKISINGLVKKDTVLNTTLSNNKLLEIPFEVTLPASAPITQPYWLVKEPEKGFYKVDDQQLVGLPMKPDNISCTFDVTILGESFSFTTPLRFKYVEPSIGEIYRYFEIRPEVMVTPEQKVYTFADNTPQQVSVIVKAGKPNLKASVSLQLGAGWKAFPAEIPVELTDKHQEKMITFLVTPPATASEIDLKAVAVTATGTYDRGIKNIKYEHIPELNLYPLATAKAVRIDLKKKGTKIGYIAGAGDEVPDALRQIGYEVVNLNSDNINKNLAQYDAILIGVRAYNTEDWLVNSFEVLMKYVENGGNLITQYQTQAFYGPVKTKNLGPHPFTIGRGRVTDENAEIKILQPAHPLLNYPNKIGPADFKGWVQERGLYYADQWSEKYTTILGMHDEGEEDLEGSLLYTPYGKGHYVFTGLSFFRQLPAGVPGAFRLMANLISTGKK